MRPSLLSLVGLVSIFFLPSLQAVVGHSPDTYERDTDAADIQIPETSHQPQSPFQYVNGSDGDYVSSGSRISRLENLEAAGQWHETTLLTDSVGELRLSHGGTPLFRVALPSENSTRSFWLDTPGANPLAEHGGKGAVTEDADVCIIGSGITGVSAAWHLAQMLGERQLSSSSTVVILEARRFCSGATGRNGGHMTPNPFSSFLARQALYGRSEAVKSYELERYTTDALLNFIKTRGIEEKVDLVAGNHITILRTKDDEAEARRDWEAALAAGVKMGTEDVRWITNRELKENYGLNPTFNYTGVFFAGHNVWPCKLVTELYKEAEFSSPRVQVKLHTNAPVTSVVQRRFAPRRVDVKGRTWTMRTPRGEVACDHVLHATNGYAGHLLPFLGGEKPSPSMIPSSKLAYGIRPTRGQVGAVRAAVNASTLGWLNSWEGGDGGWEYWFPRYQGLQTDSRITLNEINETRPLIILGGGREFSGGTLEMGITDDSKLNPLVSNALRAFLPRFFPKQFIRPDTTVGNDGWEMEWTGIMGFTVNGDPFVGPVGPLTQLVHGDLAEVDDVNYDGQYIAAGYTGHGMPRAFACAEAVARMIAARIKRERWIAPSWLPRRYLTWST